MPGSQCKLFKGLLVNGYHSSLSKRCSEFESRIGRQYNGVWLSLVEHSLWERRVVGSNPTTPTNS